ncbi:RnfABCDGE type electron transport complex subunit B [uncultured Desulfosarcina sp.]|uniref:RnfABCDGE type electron transport complex subunit B n=1 Tax=uncultured Desulfosarcina sp. TaxID=218289 RepID=UPI0029C83A9C|nr:RnfABCDGE type electron transport complex subunit B [uncultured Desulfosarcina sp.]
MTIAIILMGGLGLVVGVGLALASKVFYVYVDPKIVSVEEVLPGANCGGCGMPGCSANAEAIVAGKASPNSCVAAGDEVALAIAAILGVSVEAKEPDIALPGCTYGVADADVKYSYDGMNDCRAVALLSGGMKVCNIGCLGLGTCAAACPFDAIVMGPQGLPVVDEVKCTGCGTCERICPKHIITLSSVTRRILKEYTTEDCTTPCQRACPAGINISRYIRQIAEGDYHGSVQTIKERNPFPTVIGRICPRPCENDCRRKYVDEPVAINFLKRFAADYERTRNERVQPFKAPDTGRRIAVVGGGVQGLSAAFFAARLGHGATVFEGTDRLGGLLNTAIAKYRLPETILKWDIDGILEMGVDARTGQMLGRDVTVAGLLDDGYEAVFLASGGWDSRLARGAEKTVEAPLPGGCLLLDLLRSGKKGHGTVSCGSHTVIVGGEELAGESLDKARSLGAETVTFIFRESPGNATVSALTQAGANVILRAGVTRLFGDGESLTELEVLNGDTGEIRRLEAQTLVFSAGRFPELIFTRPNGGHDTESRPGTWTAIPPYKPPDHADEAGLFATGDALTDFSGAIKAIGAGRRAAAAIHKLIYDIPLDLPGNILKSDAAIQNVDHVEAVATSRRQIMPLADSRDLAQLMELEKGFDTEAAQAEASRCLNCGLICYRNTEDQRPLEKIRDAVNA